MKTHLYKIRQISGADTIDNLIEEINGRELEDRNSSIEGYTNRIEDIQLRRHIRSECVLVNFVKLRMNHGPGKGSLQRRTTGFNLHSTEGFAEETAALIDLTHGFLICEYNHHGARATMLGTYLERVKDVSDNKFEILPCLDDQVMRKLANLEEISRFELKVAPGKLSVEDKHCLPGINSSLDFAERAGAPLVSIALSGGPGKSTLNGAVRSLVNRLASLVHMEGRRPADQPIKTLKVAGREPDEDQTLLLDLVRGKLLGEHEIAPNNDRRFPVQARWDALLNDHYRWQNIIRS